MITVKFCTFARGYTGLTPSRIRISTFYLRCVIMRLFHFAAASAAVATLGGLVDTVLGQSNESDWPIQDNGLNSVVQW